MVVRRITPTSSTHGHGSAPLCARDLWPIPLAHPYPIGQVIQGLSGPPFWMKWSSVSNPSCTVAAIFLFCVVTTRVCVLGPVELAEGGDEGAELLAKGEEEQGRDEAEEEEGEG